MKEGNYFKKYLEWVSDIDNYSFVDQMIKVPLLFLTLDIAIKYLKTKPLANK